MKSDVKTMLEVAGVPMDSPKVKELLGEGIRSPRGTDFSQGHGDTAGKFITRGREQGGLAAKDTLWDDNELPQLSSAINEVKVRIAKAEEALAAKDGEAFDSIVWGLLQKVKYLEAVRDGRVTIVGDPMER